MNFPPAEDLIIYRRTTPRIHPVPIVINMPQIIRYDRAWIPLYKHNPSRFGWFFRVVPAHQFLVLGFSELDKPFKGGVGRNRASHTPPVAILSISAIYADVIFAKCFCSFLNRFHFSLSFWMKVRNAIQLSESIPHSFSTLQPQSWQYASIAFARIRSSASCSASSAVWVIANLNRLSTWSGISTVRLFMHPSINSLAFSLFMVRMF